MANGPQIGKAYVQIVPTADGIKGAMTDLLNGDASAAGDAAGERAGASLISKLKGVVAAAGIGAFIGKSLLSGADLEQSFGGLETIYGEASGKMKEYAIEAGKMGVSANTFAEQAVSMGAALKNALGGDATLAAEKANLAISDMMDNAAKMGTSVESLQNAYTGFSRGNYTMLDNLSLGFAGTKEGMQALLDKAQEINGIQYDISSYSDIVDAIHVVQEEMGLAGVAAQEGAETFSGSFAAMQAAASNFMAFLTTGEDIGPALTTLIETASTFALDNLVPALESIIGAIPGIIDGVIDRLPELIQSGVGIVVKLVVGLLEAIPKIIEALPELINAIIDGFASVDWPSVGMGIINGIIEGLKSLVGTLLNTVKNIAKSALDAAKDFLGIHSPSAVFKDEIGKMVDLGLAEGIKANRGVVTDSMQMLAGETVGSIDAGSLRTGSANIVNTNISDSLENANADVISALYTVANKVTRSIAENKAVLHIGDRDIYNSYTRGKKLVGSSLVEG